MNGSPTPADSACVRFEEIRTNTPMRLGVAKLNAEKSLNALSLEMIRLLDPQLRSWAADPDIACVILHGAGEKAFCAGGDIRSLYRAIQEQPNVTPNPTALAVFAEEYRLDYLLHRYPKPLLVWGSGLVLGGGLGLMVGASHRVVTETSRIAMPEVTIGFFPDVGASWFLQCMPRHTGLFMAVTGVQINAHDTLIGGLADYFLRAADRDNLFARLQSAPWKDDASENREVLSALLRELAGRATGLLPVANFIAHEQEIQSFCHGDSAEEIIGLIARYDGNEEWLQRAANTLRAGSPTSALLAFELQRRAQHLDLADTFRLELTVALQRTARSDFPEGVRALLIDKDNKPKWQPRTLAEVTPQWIDGHFSAPAWPGSKHPLADL